MNNPVFPEYSIYTAYALLGELTGIRMKEQQFLEFANIAMGKIKFNTFPIKAKLQVSEEGMVHLPCEASVILEVSDDEQLFNAWEYSYLHEGEISYNRLGDRYRDLSPSPGSGMTSYINYTFYPPNRIKVLDGLEGDDIYVAARARMLDGEGNPLLTMKQAEAVAWYAAYLRVQRDAFAGIQGMDLMYVRNRALNAVADAKVPDHVSNNELDAMMNVKVSFGRKSFNKDFKF